MREIKFRGTREDNGDWVFGSFIPDALEGSNSDLISWGFIRRYNRGIGKMETIVVDRETVGQYTGLQDKNGVEIYEGDIVEFSYGGVVRAYVRSDNGAYDVVNEKGDVLLYLYVVNHKARIIGNIHDNPELVEDAE